MVPIIRMFKKRVRNLNDVIPTDVLFFVDDGLLVVQEKSYKVSSAYLLCSYNIMSKILLDADLIMEHNKSEAFHLTRARHPPNPVIDLSSVGGPVLTPKPIWQYLGFYFDRKLNFHYHTHYYATKSMSILNAMRLLGNSSRGILPLQKRLLYRTCILPIALYGFQLWFFKGAPTVTNLNELKKMQRRAVLWITGAFRMSPTEGIEAIAGLVPIHLHLRKLNGRHHLRYASLSLSHAVNSLLDHAHATWHISKPHLTSPQNREQTSKVPLRTSMNALTKFNSVSTLTTPSFPPA